MKLINISQKFSKGNFKTILENKNKNMYVCEYSKNQRKVI